MNKYVKVFLVLLFTALLSYGIHYYGLNALALQATWTQTEYTLEGLYTFGAIASMLLSIVLLLTQYALPKQVGFVFLGGITLKAVASYLFIQAGLNKLGNDFLEINFLISFFVFLFYDVYIAYLLVNQEETTVEK